MIYLYTYACLLSIYVDATTSLRVHPCMPRGGRQQAGRRCYVKGRLLSFSYTSLTHGADTDSVAISPWVLVFWRSVMSVVKGRKGAVDAMVAASVIVVAPDKKREGFSYVNAGLLRPDAEGIITLSHGAMTKGYTTTYVVLESTIPSVKAGLAFEAAWYNAGQYRGASLFLADLTRILNIAPMPENKAEDESHKPGKVTTRKVTNDVDARLDKLEAAINTIVKVVTSK